jgi:hypothetical protein
MMQIRIEFTDGSLQFYHFTTAIEVNDLVVRICNRNQLITYPKMEIASFDVR